MRFFVSCFGVADPTATSKPLVPPPSRTLRRSKSHWRPALGSISEDTAPPHRDRAAPASAGDAKRSSNTAAAAAADTAKARRLYSDDCDYGRVAMPAMMPAFSPTPFMF
ncbi:uncharacterized protein LOC114917116 isoform X2 [Cajanus cajan]|uniref:uncharacterized protein LOC114917116 isoform X2 n=1 Tax=Cajanus cajan TaxID=3821 RepID=UPI0010FBA89C|nr:uncharacterized protein LOC114917116 isoform X2 [Cajanus cajan]